MIKGPLEYRLPVLSPLNSWNGKDMGLEVEQREVNTAAELITAVLEAGPHVSSKTLTPLGAEDWGTIAAACLAAIARGFMRPLKEANHKKYFSFFEEIEDISQYPLDEGENPEFHSMLQRLKATAQHLCIQINADEADGMYQWTTMSRKDIEGMAKRSAGADMELAIHNWKVDQLSIRQQQLEEDLKRTILERNVELFRSTADSLGLTFGNPTTAPLSRPVPSTGNKRTVSGSAPLPAQPAKQPSLPIIADVIPPQAPPLDAITLTAALQTAMQPIVARLAVLEADIAAKSRMGTGVKTPPPTRTQAEERTGPMMNQPAPDRPTPGETQAPTDGAWIQTTSKRNRRKGKAAQTNPTPQQINLTPRSFADVTATTAQTPNSPPTQSHTARVANPVPAFTEVTVIRFGGALRSPLEQATRLRQPDAIVREVRANMAKAVAKPLPIVSGRWSSGARSKGNFVFTMRGQVDFAFIQTFEHFLTGPFPGGGQLCPNQGWTKLLVHGVPIMDNDNRIFGPEDLLKEVRTMEGLRNVYFSSLPRWIKRVEGLSSCYTSLTFAFSDPDSSITKHLLKNRQALFGKQVDIERWIDKPLLVQCGRCHALGHAASSKTCRLPPDSIKCYICGKGHSTDTHDRECPRSKQHKTAGICDCRLQCLSCNKVGHHAKDRTCPAREGYRSRKPRLNHKGKGVERNPTNPQPEATPQQTDPPNNAQRLGLMNFPEYPPDEEMPDEETDLYIPSNFLPGPGLSKEEAFRTTATSVETHLAKLGIPVPSPHALTEADRICQVSEMQRRSLLTETSTEAKEAESFALAEAVTFAPIGYFYPGMDETKRRQLAAVAAAGAPHTTNPNTPGIASTSTARV